MAKIRIVEPVVRFCAVISRHSQAHDWAIDRLTSQWGAAAEVITNVPFLASSFYEDEMGGELTKTIVSIAELVDPGGLGDWKVATNEWEREYAAISNHDEPRPLNLDPGYISQAKLVLATIKDRDHRLYLHSGIFAEVTLNYVGKKWIHHRWSYADYRTPEIASFAMRSRKRLRDHLQATDGFRHGR